MDTSRAKGHPRRPRSPPPHGEPLGEGDSLVREGKARAHPSIRTTNAPPRPGTVTTPTAGRKPSLSTSRKTSGLSRRLETERLPSSPSVVRPPPTPTNAADRDRGRRKASTCELRHHQTKLTLPRKNEAGEWLIPFPIFEDSPPANLPTDLKLTTRARRCGNCFFAAWQGFLTQLRRQGREAEAATWARRTLVLVPRSGDPYDRESLNSPSHRARRKSFGSMFDAEGHRIPSMSRSRSLSPGRAMARRFSSPPPRKEEESEEEEEEEKEEEKEKEKEKQKEEGKAEDHSPSPLLLSTEWQDSTDITYISPIDMDDTYEREEQKEEEEQQQRQQQQQQQQEEDDEDLSMHLPTAHEPSFHRLSDVEAFQRLLPLPMHNEVTEVCVIDRALLADGGLSRERLAATLRSLRRALHQAVESQGPLLHEQFSASILSIVHHLQHEYDWRRILQVLASVRHCTALAYGGTLLHAVRFTAFDSTRSPTALLLLPGWPGSFLEQLSLARMLAHPASPLTAYDVVCLSVPGYGLSGAPVRRWTASEVYPPFAPAMAHFVRALGYDRYVVCGDGWAAAIAADVARADPKHCIGVVLCAPALPGVDFTTDLSLTSIGFDLVRGAWAWVTRILPDWVLRRVHATFDVLARVYLAQWMAQCVQRMIGQEVGWDSSMDTLRRKTDKEISWISNGSDYPSVVSPLLVCAQMVQAIELLKCTVSRDELCDAIAMMCLAQSTASFPTPSRCDASDRAVQAKAAFCHFRELIETRAKEVTPSPALFLWPPSASRVDPRVYERLFKDIRGWHVLKKGGALPIWETPEVVAHHIRQFCATLAEPS